MVASIFPLLKKVRKLSRDPVADLRAGWDLHVGFGLCNPALYSLMYATLFLV